jgi:hypothetical protein
MQQVMPYLIELFKEQGLVLLAILVIYFLWRQELRRTRAELTADLGRRTDALAAELGRTRAEFTGELGRTQAVFTGDLERTRAAFTGDLGRTRAEFTGELERTRAELTADLGRRTDALAADLRRTRETFALAFRELGGNLKAVLEYLEVQGTVLALAGLVRPEQQAQFFRVFAVGHATDVDRTTKLVEDMSNPLTADDAARMRRYIDMIRQGVLFSLEEAQDFHRVAHLLRKEWPEESCTALMLALSGVVLGFSLARKDA